MNDQDLLIELTNTEDAIAAFLNHEQELLYRFFAGDFDYGAILDYREEYKHLFTVRNDLVEELNYRHFQSINRTYH